MSWWSLDTEPCWLGYETPNYKKPLKTKPFKITKCVKRYLYKQSLFFQWWPGVYTSLPNILKCRKKFTRKWKKFWGMKTSNQWFPQNSSQWHIYFEAPLLIHVSVESRYTFGHFDLPWRNDHTFSHKETFEFGWRLLCENLSQWVWNMNITNT